MTRGAETKLIPKWQRYTNKFARIDTANPQVDSVLNARSKSCHFAHTCATIQTEKHKATLSSKNLSPGVPPASPCFLRRRGYGSRSHQQPPCCRFFGFIVFKVGFRVSGRFEAQYGPTCMDLFGMEGLGLGLSCVTYIWGT